MVFRAKSLLKFIPLVVIIIIKTPQTYFFMGSIKLLKASAGSGKTYQLAYQYVRSVIAEPMVYRHILAVTFTNKATEEMKSRILKEINDLARNKKTNYLYDLERDLKISQETIAKRAKLARTKILHDYSRFAVLTIDKFFQRIIRSFIKELGIDLNFNLELQIDSLLSSASDALIEEISVNESLKKWIVEFVDERIEENKRWDIKTGLMQLGSEVFSERYKQTSQDKTSKEDLARIVSTARSQAFVIKNQIKQDAEKALVIMDDNGLHISDFPFKAASFANYFAKVADGTIEAYGARVVAALESDEKWYTASSPRKNDIINVIPKLKPLLVKICDTYDKNVKFLNSTDLLSENYRNFALLSDLADKIDDICTTENIMPISQTNVILNKLISDNDTPFIFEKVGNHFNQFMIDEFQDTSTMQWENFVPLLHNALAQSEESPVLLVGDVKQSIYRWRGGDWRILANEINKEFYEVIERDLTTNYRSMRNVVEFNNNIIANSVALDNDQLNSELTTALDSGAISKNTYNELHDMLDLAYKNHHQQSVSDEKQGYVNLIYYTKNEDDQYVPPVITHVEQLQEQGYAPGEIAILVRYNAEGVKIASMLLEHKNQNPQSKYCYDVVTQEALTIGSAAVILFVVACMRLSMNNEDTLSIATYNKYLGLPMDTDFDETEVSFFNSIQLSTPEEAFEAIQINFSLNTQAENIAYLQAFHEQIITFSSSKISDIALFVKWWEDNGAQKSVNVPQSSSAINIITIHKAKGLQYKAVLIPFCNWSLIPDWRTIVWSRSEDKEFNELSEMPIRFKEVMGNSVFANDYFNELVLAHVDNINTFYVAITRAMEQLHIMLPENSIKSKSRISTLIGQSIAGDGGVAKLGDCVGKVSNDETGTVIEFGTPIHASTKEDKPETDTTIYSKYNSYDISNRLKLRFNTERYIEDGASGFTISPRNYGMLMHKVFENATNLSDIDNALSSMRKSEQVSEEEATQLQETISKAFKNSVIRSWFSDEWSIVRNENDIIIPNSSTRRPDRVITCDSETIVIDYKFGLNRSASYSRQMKEYINLLEQMGHKNIKGYIWYVSLEDVEQVHIDSQKSHIIKTFR